MRICLPVIEDRGMDSRISEHFGKTPLFAFYDDETQKLEIIKINGKHGGGRLTPAEIILAAGVDLLLCANLGSKAVQVLSNHGVDVLTGARGPIAEVLESFKKGELKSGAENPCRKD